MTPAQLLIRKLQFRRFRALGTTDPICATCGEHRWWVRYERHHVAGWKYSNHLIRLCGNCHDKVSIAMQATMYEIIDQMRQDSKSEQFLYLLRGISALFDMMIQAIEEKRLEFDAAVDLKPVHFE
jgi:hypothetical protein